MSDRKRWMPIPAKMPVLQGEVCRHQQLMTSGRPQYRAIISNAQPDSATRIPSTPAQQIDQAQFTRPSHKESIPGTGQYTRNMRRHISIN